MAQAGLSASYSFIFHTDLKDIARVEEVGSETDSTTESDTDEERPTDEEEGPPVETPYAENGPEELRLDGGALTEEFADEAKSIIWCLMKQVRVMGCSKKLARVIW